MHNFKDRAVLIAKPYIKEGLAKTRATQLPFQAHTSNNAKMGICTSIILSVVAISGVLALVGHGMAKRSNPRYKKASDKFLKKFGTQAEDEAKDVAAVITKKVSAAKKTIDSK